ncbi:transporter substrate-binding domain-containing protein [Lentilactobacillus hilgardii]|uniref:transporter substrate-binding domain-containing protein n=1 Tax=Lentilactobacillus hilgardii TaxID=1588 RepID=UPI00019C6639|nr:transporter substrate-binding domain-containing protein [Lentilactobacillus hilgardii]EEI19462.1 ABC transporter, substrate-binding protein, family 3 [Lentilactobacillus buchneri ATCC 11577]MCP9333279.1 transporter substrate-binding domain-containing protein [Lentilactobacillus hilgardii]MCP9349888.1 transporter substrate-binding domain-containing protein [Lentilactobacillus hilgardii]MCP9352816.1 transporter substrate-binding domain-containing protein [Lentilactobacillus hilgardii]MCT33960
MKLKLALKRSLLVVGIALAGVALTACGSSSSSSKNGTYRSELKQSKQLTIGLEGTYPPYSYRKDGKLTGFEVELGKAVAKKLGVKANFVPTKWDSLIAGLGSGKYDVVLNNITQTPERRKQYLFSKPYVYSRYVLITRSGSNAIKTTADIKDKKFAEATGSDNELIAKKFGAVIVPQEQFQTSLDLIKQGRAQGAINAESALLTYAKDNSIKGLKYRLLKDSEQKPAKISGLFNKKSPKLKNKFNKVLDQLRKDGTLKRLSQKYFSKDITTK